MTALPILLSPTSIPLVKKGDSVTAGQPIARKQIAEHIIELPSELGISIRDVGKYVKKNPGDSIAPGETIAIRRKFLGGEKIVSVVAGTVSRFERDSGSLVISVDGSEDDEAENDILSPIDGEISLCDNGKIVIETSKNALLSNAGIGDVAEGELYLIENSSARKKKEDTRIEDITAETIDKIVLGDHFTLEELVKSVGIGVSGVIAQNIAEEDLVYLSERQLVVPVLVVNEETYEKLRKWDGGKVRIDGNTGSILKLVL